MLKRYLVSQKRKKKISVGKIMNGIMQDGMIIKKEKNIYLVKHRRSIKRN